MIDLSVVIVSFNTREMTLRCLRTLLGHRGRCAVEVIVVDNASADGSARAIRREHPDVIVIESPTNAGFGAANNMGFARARGEVVLLLNSDAFVHEGAVDRLLDVIKADERVGVVGPRLLNEDGSLQRSCYRYPTPLQAWLENLWLSRLLARVGVREDFERWPHDEAREVPWMIGACLAVRRGVIDAVGGFDERFFMYAEETDWQRRIRAAGWRVVFDPGAVVTHVGGASGKTQPAKISDAFFSSLDLYTRLHHGRLGLVSMRAAMCVGCTLRLVLWSMARLAAELRGTEALRERARAKVRLMRWLVVRQATHRTTGRTTDTAVAPITAVKA